MLGERSHAKARMVDGQRVCWKRKRTEPLGHDKDCADELAKRLDGIRRNGIDLREKLKRITAEISDPESTFPGVRR
jgi:hypothetical protein